MVRNFLLILFIVSAHILFGQCDLKITGQVIDLDDGKELENCLVSILGQTLIVPTNEHGRFQFTNVCEGKTQIIIKHFGCRDTVISVQLTKNYHLKVKLPHSAFELQEVDIMDKRLEMKQTQTRADITGEELDKTRGLNLGEALKNVSGVTSLNTGGTISKPMIHGMQGFRVLIVNNGVRHEGQQWGNEHAPEVDPFIATRLSVIKGANAVRYGSDAIGGVVLVETPELPDTAGVTGEVNLVGASNGRSGIASAILQGNFEKMKNFSWRAQGTLRKAGSINAPNYYLKNTGVEEYNFSYALDYHRKKWGTEVYYSQFNTKVGVFSSAHIHNLTDLKNSLELKKPTDSLAEFSYQIGRPYQQIAHEMVKSKTHFHLTNKWRLNMQYAYQYNKRLEYDKHKPLNDSLAALNLPELDYRIQTQTADVVLEHDNIKSFRGQFGGSYMHQFNNYFGRFFIPNYINQSWGVFATERYVKQHIEFEAGIRYDEKYLQSFYYRNNELYSPNLKFNNISWNVGAIYKPNKYFNVFANIGSAWRAPAPNELYSNGIHHGVGAIERGREDLNPEKVINATLSGILQAEEVQMEVTAYHNQFQNFIYMNPALNPELTVKGAFPVFTFEQAKARISGLDIKSTIVINRHWSLMVKSMWLRAWNYAINDHLIYMPSDRFELNARYRFKLACSNCFVMAGYQYVTKQWRVPAQTDFAPPPEAFGLVAAEIGGVFNLGKQKLHLSIGGTNILNAVYRDYLDRFRYYTDAPGRNIQLRIKMPLVIYKPKKIQHEE
jgi:iron complex outermembrane receptor protein